MAGGYNPVGGSVAVTLKEERWNSYQGTINVIQSQKINNILNIDQFITFYGGASIAFILPNGLTVGTVSEQYNHGTLVDGVTFDIPLTNVSLNGSYVILGFTRDGSNSNIELPSSSQYDTIIYDGKNLNSTSIYAGAHVIVGTKHDNYINVINKNPLGYNYLNTYYVFEIINGQ